MKFVGRKEELMMLERLFQKESASLVVLTGRRRVGKSRLVSEFAKNYQFLRFSGIPPTEKTTAKKERDWFAEQLAEQTKQQIRKKGSWQGLFSLLKESLSDEKTVILFDEISWMGTKDPDFLGLLKDAWDYHFSLEKGLIVILCGSVSTWIEKEIVNSTAFLGRLSLNIKLKPLYLNEVKELWQNTAFDHFSGYEKLKLLSITGGVPRYLEQLNLQETANNNIKYLFFNPSSAFLEEYHHIFSDVFGKRSFIYKKIIENLLDGPLRQEDVLIKLNRKKSGVISRYLDNLIVAGFISRDYSWSFKTGKKMKISQYRLTDNFILFYLKFILPKLEQIKSGAVRYDVLEDMSGWRATLGLQFENLVIHNVHLLLRQMNIPSNEIINLGPYLQLKNQRQEGCQIDLLIETRSRILYVCEIKFSSNPIGIGVIKDVQDKILKLKKTKGFSCLPVLIHVNGVSDAVLDQQYFYRVIEFSSFLKS